MCNINIQKQSTPNSKMRNVQSNSDKEMKVVSKDSQPYDSKTLVKITVKCHSFTYHIGRKFLKKW